MNERLAPVAYLHVLPFSILQTIQSVILFAGVNQPSVLVRNAEMINLGDLQFLARR